MQKILLGLVVVIIVAGGGYAILHKSSNPSNASNGSNGLYGASSSSTGSSSQPATGSASSIQTKTNSSAGPYLADANGAALYTYGGDASGVSNCAGSCIANWPVYQASGSTTSLPANVTVIKRSDGTMQYAYKGLPLYTFSSDPSGQVTGDGVANFHVAKP